ncbi:MAG: VCBS repeat-containing protein [Planctomycetota bacterium]
MRPTYVLVHGFLALSFVPSAGSAQDLLLADLHRMVPSRTLAARELEVFDADGDGDLDVFAASTAEQGAVLLSNDGHARFAVTPGSLPEFRTDAWCSDHGDVDGDGDVDVFVGNIDSLFPATDGPQNLLLLNDGGGVFSVAAGALPVDSLHTQGCALGDLDGDGDLDLVTANGTDSAPPDSSVAFLNDGSGVFALAPTLLPTDADDTEGVALGDVDGDGELDVLTVSRAAQNRLYLNDVAGGAFVDATSWLPVDSDPSRSVAFADLDADGDLDAWVGGDAGSPFQLLLNDGVAAFVDAAGTLPVANPGTGGIVLEDLDADGDVDALIGTALGPGNLSNDPLLYLRNDGAASFADATAAFPPNNRNVRALGTGDFDGNGSLDVFAKPLNTTESDRLYLADGEGGFLEASRLAPLPSSSGRVAAHDFDGDGDLDAVVVQSTLPSTLLVNDGSGRFDEVPLAFPDDGGLDVALGDLDGDGNIDLVTVGGDSSQRILRSFVVDGTGDFALPPGGGATPLDVGFLFDVDLADIDLDGDLDAVAGTEFGTTSGPLFWVFDGDGAGDFVDVTEAAAPFGGHGVETFELVDATSDGYPDLAGNFGSFGGPGQYLNDGAGAFDSGSSLSLLRVSRAFLSVDYDGDGDLDVLTTESDGPDLKTLVNTGAGFTVVQHTFPGDSASSVRGTIADLDGDGLPDAVIYGSLSSTRFYRNTGGSWELQPDGSVSPLLSSSRFSAGDFDGDGDVDVLSSHGGIGSGAFAGLALRAPVLLANLTRHVAWAGFPRVGRPLELDVYGGAGEPWSAAFAAQDSAGLPLPPFGTLWLDPFGLQPLAGGTLDADGRATLPALLPADPGLRGLELFVQALVGSGGVLGLTNVDAFVIEAL